MIRFNPKFFKTKFPKANKIKQKPNKVKVKEKNRQLEPENGMSDNLLEKTRVFDAVIASINNGIQAITGMIGIGKLISGDDERINELPSKNEENVIGKNTGPSKEKQPGDNENSIDTTSKNPQLNFEDKTQKNEIFLDNDVDDNEIHLIKRYENQQQIYNLEKKPDLEYTPLQESYSNNNKYIKNNQYNNNLKSSQASKVKNEKSNPSPSLTLPTNNNINNEEKNSNTANHSNKVKPLTYKKIKASELDSAKSDNSLNKNPHKRSTNHIESQSPTSSYSTADTVLDVASNIGQASLGISGVACLTGVLSVVACPSTMVLTAFNSLITIAQLFRRQNYKRSIENKGLLENLHFSNSFDWVNGELQVVETNSLIKRSNFLDDDFNIHFDNISQNDSLPFNINVNSDEKFFTISIEYIYKSLNDHYLSIDKLSPSLFTNNKENFEEVCALHFHFETEEIIEFDKYFEIISDPDFIQSINDFILSHNSLSFCGKLPNFQDNRLPFQLDINYLLENNLNCFES